MFRVKGTATDLWFMSLKEPNAFCTDGFEEGPLCTQQGRNKQPEGSSLCYILHLYVYVLIAAIAICRIKQHILLACYFYWICIHASSCTNCKLIYLQEQPTNPSACFGCTAYALILALAIIAHLYICTKDQPSLSKGLMFCFVSANLHPNCKFMHL